VLARAIRHAMHRRAEGLLRAAVRSRSAVIGADAAAEALDRGSAALAVVACDAAAGAELPQVQRAIAEGRAVAWGTKEELGVLAGGRREQGVAVVAITSARIAAAIAEAVRVADVCAAVERGAGPAGAAPGPTGRGRAQKSLQKAAPRRMTAAGEETGPDAAERRSRGRVGRTGGLGA
jgi:ribosomal protein L7Ae-like RNA K-turn-binding protein